MSLKDDLPTEIRYTSTPKVQVSVELPRQVVAWLDLIAKENNLTRGDKPGRGFVVKQLIYNAYKAETGETPDPKSND